MSALTKIEQKQHYHQSYELGDDAVRALTSKEGYFS